MIYHFPNTKTIRNISYLCGQILRCKVNDIYSMTQILSQKNSSLFFRLNKKVVEAVTRMVDFFYPPFKKLISLQLFRYGVTGGANVCFDWVLYFIFYNFIYDKRVLQLTPHLAFTPHIASFITVFPITFLTGFWLAKYVSFSNSNIRGRVQMFRYLTVVILNILINYFGLKLLVEVFGIYPTPSKMIITIAATAISFVAQKYYSFKVKKQ